jgi:hypothetical protein
MKRPGEYTRQDIRPFCHAKGEGDSGANLARRVLVNTRAAYREVDR